MSASEAGSVTDDWNLSWHHRSLGIADLWRRQVTGRGVTVALLDTGLARPDGLDRASFQYFDAQGTPVTPGDPNGHGTCCASVIACTRGGALGIAPDVHIASFRVLETGNAAEDIESALAHILRERPDVDILSCSFVIDDVTPRLKTMVRALTRQGRVVIAAAGDQLKADSGFPELTPGAITVAAVDQQAQPLPGAKIGPWIDIAAPGQDLPAVAPGVDNLVLFGESSAAAAVASGVAALVLSTRPPGHARRRLGVALEGLLEATAVPPSGADPDAVGAGVIDPGRLLQAAAALP
jgi:subtilisin family serine protease